MIRFDKLEILYKALKLGILLVAFRGTRAVEPQGLSVCMGFLYAEAEAGGGGGSSQEAQAAPSQQAAISDAQALAAEFPGFDAGLIDSILQDQGGDVRDVRHCLQV